MNDLEELVRASLAGQVRRPPPMRDPGVRAVAGARRVRRRRAATLTAVLMVLALAGAGGLWGLRRDVGPAPVAPRPSGTAVTAVPPGVALLGRKPPALYTGGRVVRLPAASGEAYAGYQVGDHFLVETRAGGEVGALWLVGPDGSVIRLLSGTAGVAVAADGVHLGWRQGDRLYAGRLDGRTLRIQHTSPAPARGWPVAVTAQAVVLGYSATGGGIDQFDTWLPAAGDYRPSWNAVTGVLAVFGPAPGGRLLLGLALPTDPGGVKSVCLALLDPTRDLAVRRSACGLVGIVDLPVSVSPDGRWLAVRGGLSALRVDLFDLATVFDRPVAAGHWTADLPGGWVDSRTMVTYRHRTLARLVRGSDTGTPVAVPGLAPTTDVVFVQRRG